MAAPGNYDLLIGKINIFIRKYHFNGLLRGVMFLCAGLFSAYAAIVLSEYFGNFNTTVRGLLFYCFLLVNLALLIWLVLPHLLALSRLNKTLTHDQAAKIIGLHFNDVHDKLLNTLQLKKQMEQNPKHRELLAASIDQKIAALKPVNFPKAVNIRENTKYLKWIIPPAALICVIAFAAPSILTESTKRLIRHNEYFAPLAPFKYVIMNEALNVVQGDDYKLDLRLTGNRFPEDIYVVTAANTFKLDRENTSRFHYLFSNLQQNTSFKLSANGYTSKPYEIKVKLRPALLHFDVTLTYPAYLHKKNEDLLNAGDLTLPAGTAVNWKFHTQYANSLFFKINNNSKTVMPKGPDYFEHAEKIYKAAAYVVSPLNNAVSGRDSAGYRINVIADEPPLIGVEEKPDSISMKALYFNGKIQDDHGFSSLTFHYKTLNNGQEHSFIKKVNARIQESQGSFFYFWDLKDLGVNAGNEVIYYFEVADNDAVHGPKAVRSPAHTLHIPDAAALAAKLDAGTRLIQQKMQSAIRLAGQIEKNAQKINRSFLEKNSLSFDEKKQVEELLQKRRELNDLIKEVQDEHKKNLYNRQESQQQNTALTEKQKQLEQLIDHMLDDTTKDMLEKLQQLMQADQKDAANDELSKMQSDHKLLKRDIDRMLELYKKLDFEQKLNQNVNELNRLAQEQKKLADQTRSNGNSNNDLQNQQKLNQDFREIKKSLDGLQKINEQSGTKQAFENPEKENTAIEQLMQQSSDNLQKNMRGQASRSQQQTATLMQQLANKLEQKEDESESSQNAVDARQLRELLKSLVNSSFSQEKIMQALHNIYPNDPVYIALAQTQKDIKDNLKTAEDSLYSLSKRIPQIQSAVNKEITGINDHIDQSLDNMGERKTAEALRNQQFAMTAMNNLALMLSEALEQLQKNMNKGGKGKGKQSQPSLTQLSKMQQQLNQNMQKAREQMQQGNQQDKSGGGQKGASEQLARLAREQQMIRNALRQISTEKNKNGTGGLDNLDKISKEMEQTENDLVNRRITNETLIRQMQINMRLLEAEKAQQQREQDQKRESRAANELPPGYIKALTDYKQINIKQTEQIRTITPALNLYYRQKIKLYFDQLNAK